MVVITKRVYIPLPLDMPSGTDIKKILPYLKQGYETLQNIHARVVWAVLNYGAWLNAAYKLFESNKGAGKVKGTWAKWLKDNVGMSDSYARQLRELATKFGDYKKLHRLAIPFSELWKRRLEILDMITSDGTIAAFWK